MKYTYIYKILSASHLNHPYNEIYHRKQDRGWYKYSDLNTESYYDNLVELQIWKPW